MVLGSTLIAGLGGWLWWMVRDFGNSKDIFIHSAIIGSLISVVLWGIVWLGIVYFMLTQVFRERAYIEQLMRVMGLASAPLALMGLMFLPGFLGRSADFSLAVGMAALALTFGLTNIAIKSVTTADAAQVLVANLAGFFIWAIVLTLLASSSANSLQPHAPGVFLYNATSGFTADIASVSP